MEHKYKKGRWRKLLINDYKSTFRNNYIKNKNKNNNNNNKYIDENTINLYIENNVPSLIHLKQIYYFLYVNNWQIGKGMIY